MRESVGNSTLLYLVVSFSAIIMLFFVGIISYSRAYGVKNRIIEIIEKENGWSENAISSVGESIKEMGYTVTAANFCNKESVKNHMDKIGTYSLKNGAENGYSYCVYEVSYGSSGKYYVVVTFVSFNFPVIGNILSIPIYGETQILGKSYDYS